MREDIYTYGDLATKVKKENIKIDVGNDVLMVNDLILTNVNKIIIYKKTIGDLNSDIYIVVIDFLNNDNVVARKVLYEHETLQLQKTIIAYRVIIS